jgi:hypothetical protein
VKNRALAGKKEEFTGELFHSHHLKENKIMRDVLGEQADGRRETILPSSRPPFFIF